ncbi:hypothetical protein [Caballeronia sp. ATUFL_F1_KS4A]|uniref:hypothetical protein n=1 Tax=Caballeronia sp. ATUFL_F1_KS4A TaxID=2921768 RepID=UPI0020277761|nr:hypothetical protein [Caballeronia sp. ATUFL_F1_KS4A]
MTFSGDATLDFGHAGMAIQWAGTDGSLTLASTSTLPLNVVAFLIYHHGAGALNLVPQGGDFLWTGGPASAPSVVLEPSDFALYLSRVNGEYDVLVTRSPVKADWNATSGLARILNKPSFCGGSASGLHIELGYQPNDRGIDCGDHYEGDFTMATYTFGGFAFTVNSDNSISVPTGMYLIDADAQINAPVEDDWQIPAQIAFSVCVGYSYPGVNQQAVRRFPDLPLATLKKGGTLGSLILAGPLPISAGDHAWRASPRCLAPTRRHRS